MGISLSICAGIYQKCIKFISGRPVSPNPLKWKEGLIKLGEKRVYGRARCIKDYSPVRVSFTHCTLIAQEATQPGSWALYILSGIPTEEEWSGEDVVLINFNWVGDIQGPCLQESWVNVSWDTGLEGTSELAWGCGMSLSWKKGGGI